MTRESWAANPPSGQTPLAIAQERRLEALGTQETAYVIDSHGAMRSF